MKRYSAFVILLLLVWEIAPLNVSWAEAPCRAFRAKKHGVPVYREADRRSEVLGRLERSQSICGIAELKDFVRVQWPEVEQAYVRVVDVWPPKGEGMSKQFGPQEWWKMRREGIVPDDPFAIVRQIFGISPDGSQAPAIPAAQPTPAANLPVDSPSPGGVQ